jgi:hypothetical protein
MPGGLGAAKYVVVGDIDQVWALGQPNATKLVERMRGEVACCLVRQVLPDS